MNVASLYLDAAQTFADLVTRIPDAHWDRPGLGVWDLRALVGHTSRSLVTVLTYLDQPADHEDITTPERYYAHLAEQQLDPAAVAERGRQAGAALGTGPAQAVRQLRDTVEARLADADLDAIITTIAGGMRTSAYLPTRTFELVVHSIDIAAATALPLGFSNDVLAQATDLAGRIAVALGHGPTLLRALTGRTTLPGGFSVV